MDAMGIPLYLTSSSREQETPGCHTRCHEMKSYHGISVLSWLLLLCWPAACACCSLHQYRHKVVHCVGKYEKSNGVEHKFWEVIIKLLWYYQALYLVFDIFFKKYWKHISLFIILYTIYVYSTNFIYNRWLKILYIYSKTSTYEIIEIRPSNPWKFFSYESKCDIRARVIYVS